MAERNSYGLTTAPIPCTSVLLGVEEVKELGMKE